MVLRFYTRALAARGRRETKVRLGRLLPAVVALPFLLASCQNLSQMIGDSSIKPSRAR
jgi:hypothetical protein